MQNAHINSYSHKAISPAILFNGSARHFAAAAANTTNHYTYFTPTRPPFGLRIISIILHSTVSAIVSVGLFLLCLLALLERCVAGFFCCRIGFCPMRVIPANYNAFPIHSKRFCLGVPPELHIHLRAICRAHSTASLGDTAL